MSPVARWMPLGRRFANLPRGKEGRAMPQPLRGMYPWGRTDDD
jgi:hypothetical protein